MSPNDQLNVWWDTHLVGILWRHTNGQIGFRYDDNWVVNGFPISQRLPLKQNEYLPEDQIAHQFFANLLPEAGARSHLIRDLKISDSDFEILRAVGGDCAGALSIVPVDHAAPDGARYRKLSESELKKIIIQKKIDLSHFTNTNRPRLSLAGAQDKCPIFYDGIDFFLPEDAAASSHLLKFDIQGYRNIPLYECFLTQLARAVGLPVVDVELHRCGQSHYLLIKRYDRVVISEKKIMRLHQEDFCQALGVGHHQKYQQEGGPSFADCYQLLSSISANPIHDLENLLRWQIFNLLAGNSDGHAKNLSILYAQNNQIQLAPFYDLVCTRAVTRIDKNLAFSIGGEFSPDNVLLKNWDKFASDCHLRITYVEKKILEIIDALLNNMEETRHAFEMKFGSSEALQRVQKVVLKQCKKTMTTLRGD